jgi:hypothetical protein
LAAGPSHAQIEDDAIVGLALQFSPGFIAVAGGVNFMIPSL